ncbi:MAG TPA: PilZ domain-containing protein [Pirellulaceae bacterium]|nr:PilZ domain-containing protein [Pirellulaceae bacterium]
MNSASSESGQLPQQLQTEREFFGKSGPLPAAWNELRRYPRFYLRSFAQARIFPPGGDEPPKQCTILTCDISRGGMAFLYKKQLFPGQRIDVMLHDGAERSVEVQWCRRIGDGCYWAGGRFIKEAAN